MAFLFGDISRSLAVPLVLSVHTYTHALHKNLL